MCAHSAVALRRLCCRSLVALLAAVVVAGTFAPAYGQFFAQQVGGVSIDAKGQLKNITPDEMGQLLRERQKALQPAAGGMKEMAPLRKVSLRQLEAAIAEHRKKGTPIPDDIRYLAGLQRIQYVFVYPEQNDIVLAGPGEGWKLNPRGEVVGITTNLPVMLLDDLLVALRAGETLRQTTISCSIDPTTEGLARLKALVATVQSMEDPKNAALALAQSLGPQTIRVTGVPDTSHFARVMVAADYRMKRLGMGFEEAPVKGMPSFLQMTKAGPTGMRNMSPRWWMAPSYEAIVADPGGLAYELRGGSVKTLTEEEFVKATGAREQTGKVDPMAERWADNMTAHYAELSKKDPVFGQLRNCFDLALVAALIDKEHLTEKAGYSMPLLLNTDLPVERHHAPKEVDSQSSLLQKGARWLISTSGGVQINPAAMLQKQETTANLMPAHTKATPPGPGWWWN